MKDFTIAAVSTKSQPVNPTENVEHHAEWIEKAKKLRQQQKLPGKMLWRH